MNGAALCELGFRKIVVCCILATDAVFQLDDLKNDPVRESTQWLFAHPPYFVHSS